MQSDCTILLFMGFVKKGYLAVLFKALQKGLDSRRKAHLVFYRLRAKLTGEKENGEYFFNLVWRILTFRPCNSIMNQLLKISIGREKRLVLY